MKRIIIHIAIIFLLIPFVGNAQKQVVVNGRTYYIVKAIVENGDTLPYISLREIIILPPKTFKSQAEKKRYKRLVYNIKKVYPYARLASAKMYEINAKLEQVEDETERKRLMKIYEKNLRDEFEDELKNLTMTQGKLLIKLVDRETGQTTYEIVKQLRGSLSAFFWQSLAKLFGSDLKTEYDAEGEDKMIEDILVRIENGQL
ncbi:MAG TPA: DUF4294 domain-containing protein [Bacteroidales bacterium]|nr:MAG: hypothetical protein A2W98_01480 [Bacteroidetes bacterium GWF2_33_38]OFY75595.1 MAG: hypothetical protein A2265_00485 [Bacteroidetes bacterium RIFOXYA12_FULL_33_9]OFY85994.1 MAG: hypothetical protein A2236_10825 [Bacteroidetes bacterium RIFOXYA2_FULL_33_7]HBF88941.1 DUF4294 domain-containing protein [Bacteroidales bacterium]